VIESSKDIKADNYIEKTVRVNAANSAAGGLYLIYDIYKKAHGMASSPQPFKNADEGKTKQPSLKFKHAFRSSFDKIDG
jgi:hypothetical protein